MIAEKSTHSEMGANKFNKYKKNYFHVMLKKQFHAKIGKTQFKDKKYFQLLSKT